MAPPNTTRSVRLASVNPSTWGRRVRVRHLLPGEASAGGEGDGDGGVEVRAGDVADGVDEDVTVPSVLRFATTEPHPAKIMK